MIKNHGQVPSFLREKVRYMSDVKLPNTPFRNRVGKIGRINRCPYRLLANEFSAFAQSSLYLRNIGTRQLIAGNKLINS